MENDTACLVWAIFGRAVWRLASNAIEYFEITILGSCKTLNRTKLFFLLESKPEWTDLTQKYFGPRCAVWPLSEDIRHGYPRFSMEDFRAVLVAGRVVAQ